MPPLKRVEQIRDFSREHHFGLLLGWKIKTGLNKNIDPNRILTYVNWFWKNHLIPHFEEEERLLFPLLHESNPLRKKALEQHEEIYTKVINLQAEASSLLAFKDLLDAHIRFEERELFMEIQNRATPKQLNQVAELHQSTDFVENTEDMFWK